MEKQTHEGKVPKVPRSPDVAPVTVFAALPRPRGFCYLKQNILAGPGGFLPFSWGCCSLSRPAPQGILSWALAIFILQVRVSPLTPAAQH